MKEKRLSDSLVIDNFGIKLFSFIDALKMWANRLAFNKLIDPIATYPKNSKIQLLLINKVNSF